MSSDDLTYRNLVNRLPRHKAPQSVWDRLQTGMFNLDYSSMPVHHPPMHIWNRIHKSSKRKKLKNKVIATTAVLLALLAGGLSVFVLTEKTKSPKQQKEINLLYDDKKQNEPDEKFEDNKAISENRQQSFSQLLTKKTQLLPFKLKSTEAVRQEIQLNPKIIPVRKSLKDFSSISPRGTSTLLAGKSGLKPPSKYDPFDRRRPLSAKKKSYYGASFSTQLFLQGNKHRNSELSYWHTLNAGTGIDFGKFFIETGLGVSLSKDKNRWKYDYIKEELVDSYIYVDSVHYDPTTGETIFYTTTVEVYDSVPHHSTVTSRKNNYYLNIPLAAGFRMINKKDFSVSLLGGVNYNLLVHSDQMQFNPSERHARITAVHYEETRRRRHNFSLQVALRFEWTAGKQSLFYFSPGLNYFLTSVYKNNAISKPLTVGIGLGLNF